MTWKANVNINDQMPETQSCHLPICPPIPLNDNDGIVDDPEYVTPLSTAPNFKGIGVEEGLVFVNYPTCFVSYKILTLSKENITKKRN